jgi:hypothetical protein
MSERHCLGSHQSIQEVIMTTRHYGLSAIALTCLGLLIAVFAAQPAMAQRFENAHGDACFDEGYGGRRLANGGYISVGATVPPNSSGACTNPSDVFVVKLNANGTVAWMFKYDLEGNDVGEDIIELTNGDYAICGYTDHSLTASACYSAGNPAVDGFIMRINSNGGVIWCRTYGDTTRWDGFRRIIQCRFGQAPPNPARVGDLAVVGYSYDPANTNTADGYAVRVNQGAGAVVWARRFGGGFYDDFRSLIETSAGTANLGDFVMVGQSNSFNPSLGAVGNAFIVRCNGFTGLVGAAPQGAAAYGNNVNCYLWSVDELSVGNNATRLVYAGGIFVNNSPIAATDIYLLKTAASPCTYMADRRIGDNGPLTDEASTIREFRNLPLGSGFVNGNLYVTGHSYIRPGFNGDAFLMVVNPGNLALLGAFHLYGERSDDGAWYADYVPAVAGQSTEGIYMTGRGLLINGATPSIPIAPDPDQMYLLKTDNTLFTNCCDTTYTVRDSVPRLTDSCPQLNPPTYGIMCLIDTLRDTQRVWRTICNDTLHIHSCDSTTTTGGPTNRAGRGDLSDNATSAVGPEGAGGARAPLTVSFFPNPVRRGEALSLRCGLGSAGTVSILVTDLSGKEIYRGNDEVTEGEMLLRIPTDGWRSGTYLIKVTKGTASQTRRVVVTEK